MVHAELEQWFWRKAAAGWPMRHCILPINNDNDKETNYLYCAVTGTIKKNIQTTTKHIFCVLWVLNVSKIY
jgi:hypothetical protein